MLTFKDAVRQMLRDMRSQKLRTLLTVFGIVWGTVAVTLLGAFGQGLHKQIVKNSAGLGDRIAIAWPGLTSIPYEGLGRGRSRRGLLRVLRHAEAPLRIEDRGRGRLGRGGGVRRDAQPDS